jgi:hypothetical protein
MDPAALPYLGFIVAALILMWGVMELSKRYSRHQKTGVGALDHLVQLDITRRNEPEESLPDSVLENQEEDPEPGIHDTRAKQNGHYSESKKRI